MFGRDLIEQVRADSVNYHRDIPIIVEKCIYAVEQRGNAEWCFPLWLLTYVYIF